MLECPECGATSHVVKKQGGMNVVDETGARLISDVRVTKVLERIADALEKLVEAQEAA